MPVASLAAMFMSSDIRPAPALLTRGNVLIVNGHVPVKIEKGEQPIKGGKKTNDVSQEALQQTQRIIETRVNAIGVGEPEPALSDQPDVAPFGVPLVLVDGPGRPVAEVFKVVSESSHEPIDSPILRCLQEGRMVDNTEPSLLVK